NFYSGELSIRFYLKVAIVLIVVVCFFCFYFLVLKIKIEKKVKKGEIILENVLNLGSNVISSESIEE
ncbi:MAG: hypothetical protein ACUVQN_03295, partial [Caldisericia bacterium]